MLFTRNRRPPTPARTSRSPSPLGPTNADQLSSEVLADERPNHGYPAAADESPVAPVPALAVRTQDDSDPLPIDCMQVRRKVALDSLSNTYIFYCPQLATVEDSSAFIDSESVETLGSANDGADALVVVPNNPFPARLDPPGGVSNWRPKKQPCDTNMKLLLLKDLLENLPYDLASARRSRVALISQCSSTTELIQLLPPSIR